MSKKANLLEVVAVVVFALVVSLVSALISASYLFQPR